MSCFLSINSLRELLKSIEINLIEYDIDYIDYQIDFMCEFSKLENFTSLSDLQDLGYTRFFCNCPSLYKFESFGEIYLNSFYVPFSDTKIKILTINQIVTYAESPIEFTKYTEYLDFKYMNNYRGYYVSNRII